MHCSLLAAKQSGVQTHNLAATSYHLLRGHKLSCCLIYFTLDALYSQHMEQVVGPGFVMQGAFILVGNNSFGYPLLVVMAVGVLIYACWRFWEGITGQGSDAAFGPFKNFFRYRLSPLVSVRLEPTSVPCIHDHEAHHTVNWSCSSELLHPHRIVHSHHRTDYIYARAALLSLCLVSF